MENKELLERIEALEKQNNRLKQKRGKKSKSKKAQSAALGLLLTGIILIGGTFAFMMLDQETVGRDGVNVALGGRVHDVFEFTTLPGARNKEVFAENFGEYDLFVRIQIREFLELNGIALHDADIDEPQTWPLYTAHQLNARSRQGDSAEIGRAGVSWELGHAEGETIYFMPTFNHVNQGGLEFAEGITIPEPFNLTHEGHALAGRFTEASGRAIDSLTGTATGYVNHDGTRDFWITDPVTNQPTPPRSITQTLIYVDTDADTPVVTTRENVTHTARPTLAPRTTINDFEINGLITLYQWLELGRPNGNFWILDTETSWFYWNGALPAGTATSLLLNETSLPLHNALVYKTSITADFFNQDSLTDLDGLSTTAQMIFAEERVVINTDNVNQIFTFATPGTNQQVLALSDLEIRNYLGTQMMGLRHDGEFTVRIVETDTTSAVMIEDGYVMVNIAADEPNTSLTIEVNEPRMEIPYRIVIFVQPYVVEHSCLQTGTPANIFVDTTGFEWCIVAEDNGYLMLVSRYVIQWDSIDGDAVAANRLHNSQTPGHQEWTGTAEGRVELVTRLGNWWHQGNQVSESLRTRAVHADLPVLNTTLTQAAFDQRNADLTALSTPRRGTRIENTEVSPIFFLSPAEISVRLGQSTPESRIGAANRVDASGNVGTPAHYFLRTAGSSSSSVRSQLNHNINGISTNTGVTLSNNSGARPAIWIRR